MPSAIAGGHRETSVATAEDAARESADRISLHS